MHSQGHRSRPYPPNSVTSQHNLFGDLSPTNTELYRAINPGEDATPRSYSPPHAHAPKAPPEPTASSHPGHANRIPAPRNPHPSSIPRRRDPVERCRIPPDPPAYGAKTLISGYFSSEHCPRTAAVACNLRAVPPTTCRFPDHRYPRHSLENIYSRWGRHSRIGVVSFLS